MIPRLIIPRFAQLASLTALATTTFACATSGSSLNPKVPKSQKSGTPAAASTTAKSSPNPKVSKKQKDGTLPDPTDPLSPTGKRAAAAAKLGIEDYNPRDLLDRFDSVLDDSKGWQKRPTPPNWIHHDMIINNSHHPDQHFLPPAFRKKVEVRGRSGVDYVTGQFRFPGRGFYMEFEGVMVIGGMTYVVLIDDMNINLFWNVRPRNISVFPVDRGSTTTPRSSISCNFTGTFSVAYVTTPNDPESDYTCNTVPGRDIVSDKSLLRPALNGFLAASIDAGIITDF